MLVILRTFLILLSVLILNYDIYCDEKFRKKEDVINKKVPGTIMSRKEIEYKYRDAKTGEMRIDKHFINVKVPGYKSKNMEISLIEKFKDESELEEYLLEKSVMRKKKQIQLIKDKNGWLEKAVFFDENDMVIKEKYFKRVNLDEEIAKIKPGEIKKKYGSSGFVYDDVLIESHKIYTLSQRTLICDRRFDSIENEKVLIYDSSGKIIGTIEERNNPFELDSISPDRKYVVAKDKVFYENGHVAFIKINGKIMNKYEFGGMTRDVEFSNNSEYVGISLENPSRLSLFNRTGKLLWEINIRKEYESEIVQFCFLDNKYLFCYIEEGRYILFNIKGEQIWKTTIKITSEYLECIRDIAVDPKKNRILLKARVNTIVLLDLRTGEILDIINDRIFIDSLTDFSGVSFVKGFSLKFINKDYLKTKTPDKIELYKIALE